MIIYAASIDMVITNYKLARERSKEPIDRLITIIPWFQHGPSKLFLTHLTCM